MIKITREVTAGLLIRKQMRLFLERQKSISPNNIKIEYKEIKNILYSHFFITLKGKDIAVYAWILALIDMIERCNFD